MRVRLLSFTRLHILALLGSLLLGQAALAAHEFEHAIEGEQANCLICLLADHQTPLLSQVTFSLPEATHFHAPSITIPTHDLSVIRSYTARAPPSYRS